MTHDAAVLKAHEIASGVQAPCAGENDKSGQFSTDAVEALGKSGLLGLSLPVDIGGAGLGLRRFAEGNQRPRPTSAQRGDQPGKQA